MAEATAETKLIQAYEAIRHREYELITHLLDVLPKIEKVGDQRVNQVRDALFHADHPFLMVFVGPFNSGKSSLINALLGAPDLLKSGPTPTTDRITLLRYGDEPQQMNSAGEADTVFHPSALLKRVSFVDTPGLESTLQEHEAITRKFLHRCDVVVMVMLATRAMTASNLQYLQTFKDYGKKVIIAVNQIDLVDPEERETLRTFVQNQSKDHLGLVPEVWLVSAREGVAAYQPGGRDDARWQASGLDLFEAYIIKSLGDADRLRQKLQTPLQIVQNVHQVALGAVRESQSTFDQYRTITDNVARQLEAQKREQERTVRELVKELDYRFTAASDRSGDALRDLFQFSRALSALGTGLAELTGLARLLRRKDTPSPVRVTFDQYRVFEPIDEIAPLFDKLAPQLEGRDMQDIDDLVKYGNREVNALPPAMSAKLIGTIQAPTKYDRLALQDVRPELERIEEQARVVEPERIEQARRNTLLYLAVWQLIMVILMIAVLNLWGILNTNENNTPFALILLLVLFMGVMAGFLLLPLRGRALATAYSNRLLKLRAQYVETLTKAADKQIDYGMKLRRDAIAPLTRLVEAQATIQDEQLKALRDSEQQINRLEADLNAFGKRTFLGLKM